MKLINKAKSCSRRIALIAGLAGIASTGCTGPGIVGIGGGAILKGNALRTHDPMAAWALGDAMTAYGTANEIAAQQRGGIVVGKEVWDTDPWTYVRDKDGVVYKVEFKYVRQYKARGYTFPAKADGSEIQDCWDNGRTLPPIN